ncbi:Uncharacterised protein [Staphylococcus aureus]|nr:Uncharacterised protein [Staphylococcus aureus]
MGKKMGLGLSIALVVIGIAVVCLMIFSSRRIVILSATPIKIHKKCP